MKSISELLNLLAASPSDGTSLLKGSSSVSGKGNQSNGNSFGDLLTQLANQQDNAPANQGNGGGASGAGLAAGNQTAPNTGTDPTNSQSTTVPSNGINGSLIAISQTDISITESIQASTPSQLAQAEQSLATLAAGLSKLLNLFSNLQNMDPQQAQNAIVALSGGQITPSDAMGLLNTIQEMTQKDPSQNPLLMTPDQQNNLLSQAFQQMLQAQQLALGTFNNNLAAVNTGASDSAQIGNVVLQMSFSDTSISAIQQTGAQSSQVYIDLENFQMSATFIQAGTGLAGSQQGNTQGVASVFQPLPQTISDPLLQSFNQALQDLAGQTSIQAANAQGNAASSIAPQLGGSSSTDPTTQTFKNLVQLLVQSGASQAVLTSYMNQAAPQTGSAPSQSQVQNTALDNFLNNLILLAQNPSLGQSADSSSVPAPANNGGSAALSAGSANFMMENITQTSILMEAQAPLAQSETTSDQGASSSNALDVQMSAVSLSIFEANIQGVVAPPLDLTSLNSLNDAVARFNLAVLQMDPTASNSAQPQPAAISVDQILASLQAIQAPVTNTGVPQQTSNSIPPAAGNLNIISESLSISINGSNAQDINASFQAAGGSTSLDLNGAANANSTTIPQLNDFTTGIVSNGPIQVTFQGDISPSGTNVQVQISNNGLTANLSADNSQAAASATTPATTSTAQNISVSLLAGGVVKDPTQTQSGSNNGENLNSLNSAQPLVSDGQTISEVKPITPDAVLAAGSASQSGTNLNLSVNSNNDQASATIEMASSLLAAGSTVAADKNHLDNSSSINLSNGSINSAQILNQITQQIAAQAADSRTVSRLNFQLVPESLGHVTVQIALVDQSVSARIIVTNSDVKDAIQHHMVDLKAALNQAGLQIDQLQVQVQGGGGNLLAQYYQYQQEGSGYRLPVEVPSGQPIDPNSADNGGDSSNLSVLQTLVNVLA